MVPIFKNNGVIWNCNCYGAVKLLEHGMKLVERVLDKGLYGIVIVNEMQFGFMSESGTIYAVYLEKVAKRV